MVLIGEYGCEKPVTSADNEENMVNKNTEETGVVLIGK